MPIVFIVAAAAVVGLGVLFGMHLRRPPLILRRRGDEYALPTLSLNAAVPTDDLAFEGLAAGGLRVAVRENAGVVSGYEIALDGFPLDAVLRMRTTTVSLVLDRLRPDRVITEDPEFDEAVIVSTETHTTHLRALLDSKTRALLRLAIGDGHVELSGQKARSPARDAATDSRLAERLIARLATLRTAVRLAPEDVPQRLLDIVRTDPLDAVRAACIRALLLDHAETPQAQTAAGLAHTVPDARTHWMAAQALGDEGLALAVSVLLNAQAAEDLTGDAARWLNRFALDDVLAVVGSNLAEIAVSDLQSLFEQPPSAAAGQTLAGAMETLNDWQAGAVLDALGRGHLTVSENLLIGLLRREDTMLVEYALRRLAEYGTAASFEAIRGLEAAGAEAARDRIRERLQAGGRLSIASAARGALSEAD